MAAAARPPAPRPEPPLARRPVPPPILPPAPQPQQPPTLPLAARPSLPARTTVAAARTKVAAAARPTAAAARSPDRPTANVDSACAEEMKEPSQLPVTTASRISLVADKLIMATTQTQPQLQEIGGSTSQPNQEVGGSTPQPHQEVGGSTPQPPNSSASKRKRLASNKKKEPAPKRKRPPLVPNSPLARPLVTSQQAHPTAKRVRSPMAKKQLTSPAANLAEKQLKSPTPMATRSPTMRLMMSPVFIGAEPPIYQPQSSPGLPSLTALRSPSADHYSSPVRNPSMSPEPQLSLVDETRAQLDYHPGSISAKGGKPRKLRSTIWNEVDPIYDNGKLRQGRCKHCNGIFPAARNSGTSHIHRHLGVCEQRAKVNDMVDKIRSSTLPTEVAALADWEFNPEVSRGELVRMLCLHELPFALVDYDGFIRYSASLNPVFKVVCRTTITSDCIKVFENYRSVLRDSFSNCSSRVSLTGDAWTAKKNTGYFCITCHYIDDNWKVQKKIISFCFMKTPHDASKIFNEMLKSIRFYNIEDKLFSITLDNAAANTSMMDMLQDHLLEKQMLHCNGELFHVRCAAHVLNLIVKDGLQAVDGIIDNVRDSVKYIRGSPSRKEKFEEIIAELEISCKKRPTLDVATRWSSTYLMIKSALPFASAFDELAKQDPSYKYCPSLEEWERAKVVCPLLKVFKKATKVISGTKYPTSNLYFHQVWNVRQVLEVEASSTNPTVKAMVKEMQKKFDKYWKISYLTNCIPVILDPRFKFGFIEFRLAQAFGDGATEHIKKVERVLKRLFSGYSSQMGDTFSHMTRGSEARTAVQGCPWSDWSHHLSVRGKQATSELDRYLQDELFPCDESNFDILHWWKMHAPKYPILASMARDVLAVPASTVASESAFSIGSRVISEYRNSLSSSTVEALICLQDWFKAAGSNYADILSRSKLQD